MLLNAILREANYSIVMHKIRVKRMLKNIEKKRAKTLTRVNKSIYLKITIEKIE